MFILISLVGIALAQACSGPCIPDRLHGKIVYYCPAGFECVNKQKCCPVPAPTTQEPRCYGHCIGLNCPSDQYCNEKNLCCKLDPNAHTNNKEKIAQIHQRDSKMSNIRLRVPSIVNEARGHS
ncbi:unnamed protein product [Caenorhabditis bovis]|uniref:WAP domain-containing protein n=1 Tax=Caenorhabditis bovis TaxID=2654633 RepID=A0A8S1EAS2_9PELO|nr:unnamed protein product [Caenorhabditis bovis]